MKEQIVKNEDRVSEFKSALTAGIEGIVKAATIYVEAIDADPNNVVLFHSEFKDCIPSGTWVMFEAVGRRWMHPQLLLGGMMDRKKNKIVKKLPYSLQERIFNGDRFKLLIGNGDFLQIDLKEATPRQVEQICGESTIRSIAEQKAWIIEKETINAKEKESALVFEKCLEVPYTICAGKVIFEKRATLTKAEMKRILSEM